MVAVEDLVESAMRTKDMAHGRVKLDINDIIHEPRQKKRTAGAASTGHRSLASSSTDAAVLPTPPCSNLSRMQSLDNSDSELSDVDESIFDRDFCQAFYPEMQKQRQAHLSPYRPKTCQNLSRHTCKLPGAAVATHSTPISTVCYYLFANPVHVDGRGGSYAR